MQSLKFVKTYPDNLLILPSGTYDNHIKKLKKVLTHLQLAGFPKKNKTVCFLSDFREVNKRIIRTPYPIPQTNSVLQEIEGFTYTSALDLNMGYYTIQLDPDSQKICTIILPWGK